MRKKSDTASSSIAQHTSGKKEWSCRKYASVITFILLYYGISVGLSMFNTQILGKSRMNFPYPIFAALIYDLIQFTLAASLMSGLAAGKEGAVGPMQAYKDLGAARFWKVIFPCAVAAGLDIALSNCSLKHASLSFYTMVKSSSPMFILIFAFVFGLEKLSWTLAGIVGVIGVGTLLTVYNPAAFNMLGFSLVFSAAVMSGVRWALTQVIIEHQVAKEETVKNADGPLSAILFLTPPIGLIMALLCTIFEGWPEVVTTLFKDGNAALRTGGVCLAGGLLTFSLILTEYKVVENSSVITLSISGIVKEIMMITVSVFFFKDKILPINYLGLFISILGIVGYNWHKINRHKKGARKMVGDVLYLGLPVDEGLDISSFYEQDDEENIEIDLDSDSIYIEMTPQDPSSDLGKTFSLNPAHALRKNARRVSPSFETKLAAIIPEAEPNSTHE